MLFPPLNGKFAQGEQFITANQLLVLQCSNELICSFAKRGKERADASYVPRQRQRANGSLPVRGTQARKAVRLPCAVRMRMWETDSL